MKKTFKPLKGDEIKAIALELNVKEDEVREMEFRLSGQEISIDYSDDESEDDYYRPISYLQDSALEQSDQIEKDETESNGTESLKTALSKLDERSKAIVQSRWLTEDKSATLHELALRYNVSAERVRQIEQNALKKIKALMLNKS